MGDEAYEAYSCAVEYEMSIDKKFNNYKKNKMADKEFPQGIIAKRQDNAPEFVLCNLSFKVEEFVQYLQENEANGWVNLDVKRSKGGKVYVDKNEWKKEEKEDDSLGF